MQMTLGVEIRKIKCQTFAPRVASVVTHLYSPLRHMHSSLQNKVFFEVVSNATKGTLHLASVSLPYTKNRGL